MYQDFSEHVELLNFINTPPSSPTVLSSSAINFVSQTVKSLLTVS